GQEVRVGQDETAIADHWLHNDARNLAGMRAKDLLYCFDIVEWCRQRQFRELRRHTWRVRQPQSGDTRAGFHEEGITMAVVTPFELQDQVAPREAPGDADGGHRR